MSLLIPPTRAGATVTDHSGTITLGGADQAVCAANPARRGLMVQNQSTGDLWLNAKGGSATNTQPSLWIPPGAVLVLDFGQVSLLAVRIYGAVTGQAFVAEEYS